MSELKTSDDGPTCSGEFEVTEAWVAALRAEIATLRATVDRDLKDARAAMTTVEERATKADKFVRRILYGAGSMVAASLVTAVVLVYQAGEKAGTKASEARAARQELVNRINILDSGLTEVRSQAKLLLENQLRTRNRPP